MGAEGMACNREVLWVQKVCHVTEGCCGMAWHVTEGCCTEGMAYKKSSVGAEGMACNKGVLWVAEGMVCNKGV